MEEIDLILLFKEFWKKRKIIILIFAIVFCVSTLYFVKVKNKKVEIEEMEQLYLGKTSLLVVENDYSSEISKGSKLQNIVANLVGSDLVLNQVKESLNIENIEEYKITIISKTDGLVSIYVSGVDKDIISAISDKIIEITKNEINQMEQFKDASVTAVNYAKDSIEEYDGTPVEDLSDPTKNSKIIEEEEKNNQKISVKQLAICIILSGMASFGLVFVLFIFDTKIKSEDQLKDSDDNIIDSLRYQKSISNSKESELTTIFNYNSENSKTFKVIASKILNSLKNTDENVLLVSSTNAKDGKTYITTNLGIVLSMYGKKVVIIDANFDNPKLHDIFKVPNSLGFSNYLTGLNGDGTFANETLNNFIQETDIKGLNIITSGDIKENITNFLVTDKVDELIKQLKLYYDYIIIDSEKIVNSPNSLLLTKKANNTILVIRKDGTKIEDYKKAKTDIKEVGGKLFGVIMNETK